ncbi:MAG: antibiotic biosynthesis monooxygenase [Alphaproteobacteria bacterium]|nr:antibiotic biosynthesis monooxygenase [Alphaproteobacteria bacterium]
MILEQAVLAVKPGQAAAFEDAMRGALPLIAATPGFQGIEIRPCLEHRGRYLLLARWDTLEAHTVDFRESARYQEWRRLLHHFYDPFPDFLRFGPPVAAA